ncbi:NAD-dependent epimerase/dehydratase family protein [Microbacterium thalassium]|uniref:Dihydroflavonol-4-reductase n=1 Tax=Microbacterium thalassium TaxID=362649 RepID=A0A7X0KT80_9MICO|nr:NAD-dependent epimerase/dehydratase family protein [Microbacterium thalassium]MBB6389807.1 dihydroflavonol-4-reductase [Microbacterium thalassium]GLK24495.1 dihydroflavonol-4-reductase [Microbacterium thalassium]
MSTVLVTGASGFIAKHIVRELLEQGHAVKAAVRSGPRRAQVEALFPDAPIEFVSLDLTADEGWDAAMAGVDVLMHTASPFPVAPPRDPQDLIRPAVDGTLRALGAAQAAGVTRVVLTSTCGAIYKPADREWSRVKTREDWTETEGPKTTAYEASKTLAEQAAWRFVGEHPEMRLTTVNPGMVFGPAMDEHYGSSLATVEQLVTGSFPMAPKMNMPVVDVRDVARIHVRAMSDDGAVGQRFPANAGALSVPEMAALLSEVYPDAGISRRVAPDWLVRTMSAFMPAMKTAAQGLGLNADVDGSDAPRQFGFDYIPSRDALLASAEFIRAYEPAA